MDPARSERPASDALSGAERDARIEQLLLTGLDRIERLGGTSKDEAQTPQKTRAAVPIEHANERVERPPRPRRVRVGSLLLLFAALGAAAVAVWGVTLPDLSGWTFPPETTRSAPVVAPVVEPVPLPSASE